MTIQFSDRNLAFQLVNAISDEIARYHEAMEKGAPTWDAYNVHVGTIRGLRWAAETVVEIQKANEREDTA